MRRLLLLGFVISAPCYAVPVIPNFTQGSSTSRTETSTIITESIRTTEYNSGFLYSVTGSGIQHDGSSISPAATTVSETINGTTHTWQGLNLDSRPNWTQTTQGDATPGSSITVGTVPNFSDITSTSAGSVGTSAVAIDNHNITMTPGTGTGIVITGQFVVDLTIE